MKMPDHPEMAAVRVTINKTNPIEMPSGGFGHAAQVRRWRACGRMIQAGCDTSRVTHHSCLNYVTHSNLHQHVATRDNTPVPGGQYSHSRGDNTPTPGGDNTPTPGGTILLLPGDNTPAAAGTILPLPADNTPTPGGTILPLPGGQYSHSQGTILPLPGRQYSHSRVGQCSRSRGTILPVTAMRLFQLLGRCTSNAYGGVPANDREVR